MESVATPISTVHLTSTRNAGHTTPSHSCAHRGKHDVSTAVSLLRFGTTATYLDNALHFLQRRRLLCCCREWRTLECRQLKQLSQLGLNGRDNLAWRKPHVDRQSQRHLGLWQWSATDKLLDHTHSFVVGHLP